MEDRVSLGLLGRASEIGSLRELLDRVLGGSGALVAVERAEEACLVRTNLTARG